LSTKFFYQIIDNNHLFIYNLSLMLRKICVVKRWNYLSAGVPWRSGFESTAAWAKRLFGSFENLLMLPIGSTSFKQSKLTTPKSILTQSRAASGGLKATPSRPLILHTLSRARSPSAPAFRLLRRVRGTRPTATFETRTKRLFGFNMRAETQENGGAA